MKIRQLGKKQTKRKVDDMYGKEQNNYSLTYKDDIQGKTDMLKDESKIISNILHLGHFL